MRDRLVSCLVFSLALTLTWLTFGVLWWAPLIFAESYQALGGVFPIPTTWMMALAANGIPLLFAAGYTVVLIFLFLRTRPWRAWVLAGMAGFVALWLACALVAMAIPLQKCGYHLPDLPWQGKAKAGCLD